MFEHILEFLGRTHLVMLHFPIALIIVAAVIDATRLCASWRSSQAPATTFRPSTTASLLVAFAVVTTIYTTTAGLILGFSDGEQVDLHRITGIVSTVLVLFTGLTLLLSLRPTARTAPKFYLPLLCISAVSVGFTGHLGGELVHGEGYITHPLTHILEPETQPTPVATLDPAAFGITQASLDMYLETIQPIFDQSCIECHGAEEAEEDVRLDALEYVLDPDLDIIERGDPDASELVYLIELPAGDPDIMPPEDESEPLTPDQIDAVRAWVESLGS